jgi:hypothetical protein
MAIGVLMGDVGWLWQYPEELELLFAPLCCLEVKKGTEPVERDGVVRFDMVFNQNQQTCDPAPPRLPPEP